MTVGTQVRGFRMRRSLSTCGAVAMVFTLCVLAPAASAKTTTSTYAQGHAYRHGTVPERGHQLAASSTSSVNLYYHGGRGAAKIGVTIGAPKVYLVFWG